MRCALMVGLICFFIWYGPVEIAEALHYCEELLLAIHPSTEPKPIGGYAENARHNEMPSALGCHDQARKGRYSVCDVILDDCRGIELESGDISRPLDEMKRAGAVVLKSRDL